MEPSIYEYPGIFRRVHMEKPAEIGAEVDFMRKVWRRHLKRPACRVLDVACGDFRMVSPWPAQESRSRALTTRRP